MKIGINGLKIYSIVGVYNWEQSKKRDIIVNIAMEIDGKDAAAEDDIKNTVNYEPISNKIVEQVEDNKFKTIEYLGHFILDLVLAHDDRIKSATIEVIKPKAHPKSDSTSVIISS